MAKWLFNSKGHPVAFINDDKIFSKNGRFVGRIDGDEVWHGRYKGEIVNSDRFLYRTSKDSVVKGHAGTPGSPGIPGMPGSKGVIGMPSGYRDVDFEE